VIPLVWLAGASGTGKSTAGYGAFRLLADTGVEVAYVDADQLRLAAGVTATEDELVAASLVELVPRYAAAGARALIVSGIADDSEHLRRLVGALSVTPVVLRADPTVLRDRLLARGWGDEQIASALASAEAHDDAVSEIRIDTTASEPSAVCARVAEVVARVATASAPVADFSQPGAPPDRILLVTGPGGVGLSTAGWLAYVNLVQQGIPAAYADAFQVGFCPAPESARIDNAIAHAGVLASHGVTTLVVTGGPSTVEALTERWPHATVSWLAASPKVLGERIAGRARGFGPGIPGDWRIGLTGAPLAEAIAAGVAELGAEVPGATVISTDDLAPADVAADLTRLLFPHRA